METQPKASLWCSFHFVLLSLVWSCPLPHRDHDLHCSDLPSRSGTLPAVRSAATRG